VVSADSHEKSALTSKSQTAQHMMEKMKPKVDPCIDLEHYLIESTRGIDNIDEAIAAIDRIGRTGVVFSKCMNVSRKMAIYKAKELRLPLNRNGESLTDRVLNIKSDCHKFEDETRQMVSRILHPDRYMNLDEWLREKELFSKQFKSIDSTCPKLMRAHIIHAGIKRIRDAFRNRPISLNPKKINLACENLKVALSWKVSEVCTFTANTNIESVQNHRKQSLHDFNKFVESVGLTAFRAGCPIEVLKQYVSHYTNNVEEFFNHIIAGLEPPAAVLSDGSSTMKGL